MTSTTTTTNNTSTNNSSNSNVTDSNTSDAGSAEINSIEAEYNKIPDRTGWHRLYQDIREKSDREATEKHFSTFESEKPQNRCLNRYRDVNPYDHSRIILHRGSVDYINANLVKVERADRKYILTQGPLSDTVGHFWLMVWEQNTKAILMLNKLMEKKTVKCHLYWPERKGPENALKLKEVKLTVELLRCEEYKNFCRRWFKLTDLESNQSREIIQFHYTTWPDFGIPSSPNTFLQFLKQVRDSGALEANVGPAVVHCSAGIGRSGTFCLVDCCLVLVEKEGVNNVSVLDVLYEMRRYRMGLIQTADQLYFSYQAIIEGIKLLKDPDFLDYNETPIISNDNESPNEHFTMDETPPPLPPRTHSLLPLAGNTIGGGGCGGSAVAATTTSTTTTTATALAAALTLNTRANQTKPLPKIPASESFNDDLYATDNKQQQHHDKDALNNFINNEKNADSSMSNRPLPPLPQQTKQNSLDRVHESESDENEFYEDSETEEDNVDDNDDNDDDDNNDDDDDDDNDDDKNANNETNGNDILNDIALKHITKTATTKDTGDLLTTEKLSNGIQQALSHGAASMSPENELKRRKRVERQANIEQKVNEIKRKQREAEEGKQTAKKRRSLVTYLAAGVIVGVICVYAYTKFA